MRRKMIAVEVTLPAEGRTFAALAQHLTPEAVTVQTFHALPVGTELIVQIALPDGIARCEGSVQRADPGGLTIGFDAVSPADRARIAQAIGFVSTATA